MCLIEIEQVLYIKISNNKHLLIFQRTITLFLRIKKTYFTYFLTVLAKAYMIALLCLY